MIDHPEHDVSAPGDNDAPADLDVEHEPEKPPQIEAWKMEGTEGLPDDVRTTPIPNDDDGTTVEHHEGE